MNDWKIIKSKSDAHPEFGFPMGEILCKSLKEAEEYIEESEFKDCYILDYCESERWKDDY